jgi:hypothetical protein
MKNLAQRIYLRLKPLAVQPAPPDRFDKLDFRSTYVGVVAALEMAYGIDEAMTRAVGGQFEGMGLLELGTPESLGTFLGPGARPPSPRPASRPLELPDQALELADPLAEGGVLGEKPGAPVRDATARGANALRLAARQGAAADRAQTGLWRRTYVTRRDVGPRGMRRDPHRGTWALAGSAASTQAP